jgi:hypothetical protein
VGEPGEARAAPGEERGSGGPTRGRSAGSDGLTHASELCASLATRLVEGERVSGLRTPKAEHTQEGSNLQRRAELLSRHNPRLPTG